MTLLEMENLFSQSVSENSVVPHSYCASEDLNALMLLWHIANEPRKNMIHSADHERISLSIDPATVAFWITPYQIRELVSCGVRYTKGSGLYLEL